MLFCDRMKSNYKRVRRMPMCDWNIDKDKAMEKILKMVNMDDMKFFEEFVLKLSIEEQIRFWKENPCFLKEYGCSIESLDLLQDANYRNLRRMILESYKEEDKYG